MHAGSFRHCFAMPPSSRRKAINPLVLRGDIYSISALCAREKSRNVGRGLAPAALYTTNTTECKDKRAIVNKRIPPLRTVRKVGAVLFRGDIFYYFSVSSTGAFFTPLFFLKVFSAISITLAIAGLSTIFTISSNTKLSPTKKMMR